MRHERWKEIAKTVLRFRHRPVAEIVEKLEAAYGPLEQIVGGDELYPSETTWYFTAPKQTVS